jgi:hypothetical protein
VAVQPPEDARREHVAYRIVPGSPHADCDVVLTARESAKEVADERNRLLEIGGHHGEVLAFCGREAGANGAERPKVARQRDQLRREPPLHGKQPAQQKQRGVRGAVDNEDRLETPVELVGEPVETLNNRRERLLVAVDGNDDGINRPPLRLAWGHFRYPWARKLVRDHSGPRRLVQSRLR